MGTKADKTLRTIRNRARRRVLAAVVAIFQDEKLDELAYYEVLEHGPIKLVIEADPAWNVTRVRLLKPKKPKKVCPTCGGIGWLIWPEAPADRCECNPEPPEAPSRPKPVPTPAQLLALRVIHSGQKPNAMTSRVIEAALEEAYDRGWLRRVPIEGDTANGRGYYELTRPGLTLIGKTPK